MNDLLTEQMKPGLYWVSWDEENVLVRLKIESKFSTTIRKSCKINSLKDTRGNHHGVVTILEDERSKRNVCILFKVEASKEDCLSKEGTIADLLKALMFGCMERKGEPAPIDSPIERMTYRETFALLKKGFSTL